MALSFRFRLLPLYHALAFLALAPNGYALSQNFLISPSGTLPTTVPPGGSVLANFTLTNLTSTRRDGYTVQGFPGTVKQVTTGGNCSNPINLAGHASCNLQFSVTGKVNSYFGICKGNSCTTSPTPLTVTVHAAGASIRLASGTYNNSDLDYFPLLLQNNNGTLNYPATIISALPTNPTYVSPDLYSVACSGSLCVAVGGDDNGGINPLVALSLDTGTTWTYLVGATGTWPSDFAGPGVFASASCTGNLCIAGGNYTDTNTAFPHPFLFQYLNGAWNFPITATNPPPDFDLFGAFNAVSCSDAVCIAVGTYENSEFTSFALLAQTTDGGTSWSYVIDDSTVPHNFNGSGAFLGASCYQDMCVAAGGYEDSTTETNYPLLAQSTDGGQNWSYAIDDTVGPQLTGLLIPFNAVTTQFNSTSCSATICVAAGTYFNNDVATQYGLLAQSTNSGGLWTYAISTLAQQPSDFLSGAQFNSASCDGNFCVAAGYYINQSLGQVPMVAQTIDGGTTWTYGIDSATGPLPPGYTSTAQFDSTSCQNGVCIAVGSYMAGQGTYPMYAQSTNGGAWTYVVDDNSATLPGDFNNFGVFKGSE